MDRIVQSGAGSAEQRLDLDGINEEFNQYEQVHTKMKQLFEEANDAKDKGQWKKAQNLLFEAWKLAKS